MKNFIQTVFFPSYKRTLSVLVILILVLSVPITLRLVGQQQDLRQRADSEQQIGCTSTAGNGQLVTYYCSDSNTWTYDIYSSDRSRKENTYSSKCSGTSTCITKNSCVYCQETTTITAPTTGNCGTQNCDSSQTCIYNYSGGSAVCFSKGTAGTGAYCGSPNGPNNEACRSNSCGSDSLCVDTSSPSGSGGTGNCGTRNCNSNETCIKTGVNIEGTTCLTKGVGALTSYCGTPSGAANSEACSSGYCNPSTLLCETQGGGGGQQSGGAPAAPATTSSTELPRPSVSGQGYTGGCNSISLTWGAVTGATSYIIKRYDTAGVAESASNATYTTTSTNYTATGLISNPLTAYFFNIYATNGSITSPKSSILAATGACTTGQVPPPTTTTQTCNAATCPAPSTCVNNVCTAPAATCSAATCPAPSTCVNNVCTAPTTTAATTSFAFTASLPGISSGGLGRNANPKKNSRTFSVALFAPNTQTKGLDGMIGSIQQANLVFNGSNNYTGQIQLAGVPAGSYFVKIKTDNSNWKLVSGVQTLTQGSTTTVPQVTLVTGDLNNNNGLDVGDYSSMISCIKNSCDGNTKALADLNDDSLVDEVDLNILYSGFSNRNGD